MKLFSIFYTSEAEKDIDEIEDFYDSKQDDLGSKFVSDLENCFESLKRHPEMYARFKEEIRKGNLQKFPYSFYYQNDMPEELVNVLGVFAQAQDPERIIQKLDQRMKELKK